MTTASMKASAVVPKPKLAVSRLAIIGPAQKPTGRASKFSKAIWL